MEGGNPVSLSQGCPWGDPSTAIAGGFPRSLFPAERRWTDQRHLKVEQLAVSLKLERAGGNKTADQCKELMKLLNAKGPVIGKAVKRQSGSWRTLALSRTASIPSKRTFSN